MRNIHRGIQLMRFRLSMECLGLIKAVKKRQWGFTILSHHWLIINLETFKMLMRHMEQVTIN